MSETRWNRKLIIVRTSRAPATTCRRTSGGTRRGTRATSATRRPSRPSRRPRRSTSSSMSRGRTRPWYSRLTPLASTSIGPSRSRVRNVDAIPRRPLSRNSTIVACVPTATISSAPASNARSSAASSLVPSATNRVYSTPASASRCDAGRAAVGVHVVDELGAAVEGDGRERVEVADDDVGPAADVDQRVGATVDRDQHRSVFADVSPQRAQVVLVVEAAHDHERVPAPELGREVRQLERPERLLGLLVDVLEGVAREGTQLGADALARLLHPLFDLGRAEQVARGQLLTRRATALRRVARRSRRRVRAPSPRARPRRAAARARRRPVPAPRSDSGPRSTDPR